MHISEYFCGSFSFLHSLRQMMEICSFWLILNLSQTIVIEMCEVKKRFFLYKTKSTN